MNMSSSKSSHLAHISLLAALYYLAAELGLSLSVVGESVSLIWPPTGLALAALLLFGRHLWPGVALGALLANAATDVPLWTAAGIACGNTLEALAGVYLLRRIPGFDTSLERVRDVFGLVFLAAAGSTAISASLGTLNLALANVIPWEQAGLTWLTWWMGDAMGNLVFAPALLVLGGRQRNGTWQPSRYFEAIALLAGLIFINHLIFNSPSDAVPLPAYLAFPFAIWAALRFGQRGAALAVLLTTSIALLGTLRGSGPFFSHGLATVESLGLLWLFANALAITSLVLAASLSERRRAQQSSHDSEQRYHSLIQQSPDGIFLFDPRTGMLLETNARFLTMTGLTEHKLIDSTIDSLAFEPAITTTAELLTRLHAGPATLGEFKLRNADEHTLDVELSASLITLSGKQALMINARDIKERKQAEARIQHLAEHDALTGLPNRLLLRERAEQALLHARRHGHCTALLFIDLDRFKVINDTLGHKTGDILLEQVAGRLRGCMREEDTVARQGGDEFVMVLTQLTELRDAGTVAQKIQKTFSQAFKFDAYEFHISPSIGISVFPGDGDSVDTLMKNADIAMYHAKRAGGNGYHYYTAQMNARAFERLTVEHALRQALDNQEITLHYQPQLDLASGRITGIEALARWQHPQMGWIPPDIFIPIAEECGLIAPLGEWVLREACRQINHWRAAGHTELRMAVNLSARQFTQGTLPAILGAVLRDCGTDPAALELEVTESVLMQHTEDNITTLKHLHDMGMLIAMDDFGTGYSSLSYLKRFPIDKLKIDRAFIRDLPTDTDDAAITTAIIAMARSLNLGVIAEGVETAEQLAFLQGLNCDGIQGYHLSRPLPAAECGHFLDEYAGFDAIKSNRRVIYKNPSV